MEKVFLAYFRWIFFHYTDMGMLLRYANYLLIRMASKDDKDWHKNTNMR